MKTAGNIDFSGLLDGLADAVFISECHADGHPGNYIYGNQAVFDLLEYTNEELIRKSVLDINRIAREDSETYRSILEDLNAKGRVLYRAELLSKSGHWVHVEMSCKKFNLFGRPLFLCSMKKPSRP